MAKKKKASTKLPKLKDTPSWWANQRLLLIVLFAFSVLLYANTLGHDYSQDDAIVIYDNEFTTQGVAGIPDILKYDTFRGFFKEEGKDKLVSGGRYRPLTLVMFALEWQFFGSNPFIGHLVNILLFGLTSVLLFLTIKQLTKGMRMAGFSTFVALVATVLFAAHPVHTEAVANIKGRDEIVSLLGSLAALYFCMRAYREKNQLLNLYGVVCFFLALFSKENAITFLAVIPMALAFFTKSNLSKTAILTAPYIAAAVVFLMIRGAVIGWDLGDPPQELMNNPFLKWEGNRYVPFTFAEILARVSFTLWEYLGLLIFPHPLTHDYYPNQITVKNWFDIRVILSALFHILLLAYVAFLFISRFIGNEFKKRPLVFCAGFYLATLSIVSNLFFPVGTNMSERFIYMPSVGFCLALGVLGYSLAQYLVKDKKVRSFKDLQVVLMIVGIVAIAFSVKTITRNTVWKNNYTLFTTDINTSSNSAKLRNSVGGELITQATQKKNEAQKQQMLEEAIGHLKEAVTIHPIYKHPLALLGNAHFYLQRYDESIAYFQQALRMDPNYSLALENLSKTYARAGRYYGEEQGNLQKALQYLQESFKMNPNNYETVRLLGVAYGQSGQHAKAVEFFEKALALQPNNADAMWNLGSAYYYIGQTEKANKMHQKAIQLKPEYKERLGN